jgi:hypothetical protein
MDCRADRRRCLCVFGCTGAGMREISNQRGFSSYYIVNKTHALGCSRRALSK